MRLIFALVTAIASLDIAGAVAQENRGTPEQRAACTPDAFRLCSAYIPDPTAVEACLRFKKSELSEACSAVFDHAGAESTQGPIAAVAAGRAVSGSSALGLCRCQDQE